MKDLVSDGFAQVVKPYIDDQDTKTREMLAPVEPDETNASRAYAVGEQLILNGILYKVTVAIAKNGVITPTGSGANIALADNITDQKVGWDNFSKLGAVNLVPNKATTTTSAGIVWTVNDDGTVTADGTQTGQSTLHIIPSSDNSVVLPAGKYRLSGCPSGGGSTKWQLKVHTATDTNLAQDYGNGATFTLSQATSVYLLARVNSATPAQTVSNLTFKPMITLLAYNGDYAPYAKTNKELTEDVEKIESLIETDMQAYSYRIRISTARHLTIKGSSNSSYIKIVTNHGEIHASASSSGWTILGKVLKNRGGLSSATWTADINGFTLDLNCSSNFVGFIISNTKLDITVSSTSTAGATTLDTVDLSALTNS